MAGFIGSHVARQLLAGGYRVVGVDNLETGVRAQVPPGVHFYRLDIRDRRRLERLLAESGATGIVHLAAQVQVARSQQDPDHDRTVNLEATAALAWAAARCGVRRFVFSSSAAVYGDPAASSPGVACDEDQPARPISPYGLHKWLAEQYLIHVARVTGLEVVILRYANVYGPHQRAGVDGGVVAIFCERLAQGRPLVVFGDGTQTRDFVYVDDVARATIAALAGKREGIYHVSSGRPTSILELTERLAEVTGITPVLEFAAPRPGDILHSTLANGRIRRAFNWQPFTDLSDGLRQTWAYYRSGGDRGAG